MLGSNTASVFVKIINNNIIYNIFRPFANLPFLIELVPEGGCKNERTRNNKRYEFLRTDAVIKKRSTSKSGLLKQAYLTSVLPNFCQFFSGATLCICHSVGPYLVKVIILLDMDKN